MPSSPRMSFPKQLVACCLVLIATTAFLARVAGSEPFWKSLFTDRTVEADPNGDYTLKKENGPWLVMASTFSGEGAEAQARELVLELRSSYHMRAYYYKMEFDFSESSDDGASSPYASRLRYQHEERREIAVLVGDFVSVDDPEAQHTLDEIKYITPHALNSEEHGSSTNQNLAVLRSLQIYLHADGDKRKQMGPMNKAFVARNPLLPKEYFVSQGVDEFVASMNEGVPFSLLDCQGNFTVQVATFTGAVILDQKLVQDYEEHGRVPKSKNSLEQAAVNAHKLTMLLRDKGYEAYEFHDRYCSIVTVGAFAAVGTNRQDGKIELDPRIYRTMQTFQGTPLSADVTGSVPGYQVKTVGAEKIPLDIQPKIVPVPRRAASAIYAGQ